MATIEVHGSLQAATEIEGFAGRFVDMTREGLLAVAYGHNAFMVEGWLSGSPLRRRTGRLAGNWTIVEAPSSGNELRVVEGTDTEYARAQNYGFHGPVWVRQHVRRSNRRRRGTSEITRQAGRRDASGVFRKGAIKKPLSMQRRAEGRAKRSEQARREHEAQAAHGMSRSQLARDRLQARRRRGIQGGIAETVSPALARDAAAIPGATVVRAHGRFMKLRGHRFVERSLAAFEDRAVALMEAIVQRAIGRANG